MRAQEAEKPGDVLRLRTASRSALSALAAAFLAASPVAWGESPRAGGSETDEGTAGSLVAPSLPPPEARAPELSARPHTEAPEPDLGPGPTTPGSSAQAPANEPEAADGSDEEPSRVPEGEVESREPDSAAEARPAKPEDTNDPAPSTPAGPVAPMQRLGRPDTYDSWAGLLESSLRDAGDSLPAHWRPRVAEFCRWAASLSGTWIGLFSGVFTV